MRTVRGLMAILLELWTKEGTPGEVITTYQYVFDLRNRIEETCQILQDNLFLAQKTYKRHFDKKAKPRILTEGEKVLVMLPTASTNFCSDGKDHTSSKRRSVSQITIYWWETSYDYSM